MHNSRNARIPRFPHSPSERFSSRLKLRQLDNGKSTSVSIRSQRNESIVRHNKLAFMFSDSIRYALSCHRATWRFRWCAHFASKFLENSFRSRLRANGNESFFLSLSSSFLQYFIIPSESARTNQTEINTQTAS